MQVVKISSTSKLYPYTLLDVPNHPQNIYAFGGGLSEEIFRNCVGIVGSRIVTEYTERITRKFAYSLAESGITVVSGFMYGVDTIAHASAVEAGGKTIAVLPSGVKNIVPKSNTELYSKVCIDGCVMSEFLNDLPPKKWMFVKRNHIIAGISKLVLVTQAAIKSGSLITAKAALRYGRKVCIVPSDIFSHGSDGLAELYENGATVVYKPEQLIDMLNIKRTTPSISVNMRLIHKDSLLDKLKKTPLSADEISHFLNLNIAKTSAKISELEINGLIKLSKTGKYYVS